MASLPRLVAIYGAAAGTLGADFYDDVRASDGAPGRFRAFPVELPNDDRTDSLARWAVGSLYAAEPDFTTALSKVGGGTQRIIANATRETIATAAIQDPSADGWVRETDGAGCQFCTDRSGISITSEVIFQTHDDCGCVAVPAFS